MPSKGGPNREHIWRAGRVEKRVHYPAPRAIPSNSIAKYNLACNIFNLPSTKAFWFNTNSFPEPCLIYEFPYICRLYNFLSTWLVDIFKQNLSLADISEINDSYLLYNWLRGWRSWGASPYQKRFSNNNKA